MYIQFAYHLMEIEPLRQGLRIAGTSELMGIGPMRHPNERTLEQLEKGLRIAGISDEIRAELYEAQAEYYVIVDNQLKTISACEEALKLAIPVPTRFGIEIMLEIAKEKTLIKTRQAVKKPLPTPLILEHLRRGLDFKECYDYAQAIEEFNRGLELKPREPLRLELPEGIRRCLSGE